MRLYIEPDRKTWAGLCVRPDTGAKEIDTKVRQIVRKVKAGTKRSSPYRKRSTDILLAR